MKIFKGYTRAWAMLCQYWQAYGGAKALALSPYFHFSLVFVAISRGWVDSFEWVDSALSVVPSILGFSLGAFAIFLAFADQDFVTLLTKKVGPATSKTSAYVKISALFVHFMLVQAIAILLALLGAGLEDGAIAECGAKVLSGFGYFFFIYSIFTTVAIAFSLLKLAQLFNKFKAVTAEIAAKKAAEEAAKKDRSAG